MAAIISQEEPMSQLITVEKYSVNPDLRSDFEVQTDVGRLFRQTEPGLARLKYSFLRGSIVVLEGLIGAGKSSLGESLCEYLCSLGFDVAWFPEQIPKSLLPLYTKEMRKYAFPFQVIVARDRKVIFIKANELARQGKIVLIDRGLLGDYTFALMQKEKGFFTDNEFIAYMDMISTNLPEPTFTVFLDCPPETAFERMKKRGDQEEINGYTLEYFQDLNRVYHRIISTTKRCLKIDWIDTTIIEGKVTKKRCRKFLDLLWTEHLRQLQ